MCPRRRAADHHRDEDGNRSAGAVRRCGAAPCQRWRRATRSSPARCSPRSRPAPADGIERCARASRHVGAGARGSANAAGPGARAAATGFDGPRRGAPARPRQTQLPRAHRPAARRRIVPRSGQRRRLRVATTTTAASPRSRRPTTSAAGASIEGRTAIVCADDFTSRGGHADGAIGAKSLYLDRLSIELRVPSVRLLDGSSGGGSVAAMVPQQKKEGESAPRRARGAITAGRPRVAGSGGSFLPGHLGSTRLRRAARHRAGRQRAARQRGRHRRGQGGARPLLGDGARHRPAVRGRPAGGRATRWATRSPRRTSATGASTAATARSTTSPRPRRKRWR